MKWYDRGWRCVWIYACIALMSLLPASLLPAQEPIEDLRVPMEYYPDGTLKSELLAERAEVLPDETIAASGIVFRVFSTNNVVDMTLKAVDALCRREQQSATSEKAVSMQRGDLTITGEGFVWNGTAGTLLIRRQARITFPTEMIKAEGVRKRAQ